MVTPPIGFAAYAGAAIAESDTMRTSFKAWMFSLAGFILPYIFVYNNSLLMMGSFWRIICSIITSIIGVICLGDGVIGYTRRKLNFIERIIILIAAVALIKPGYITDIIGIAIATILFTRYSRTNIKQS
jgi:TRAP-type uncharacterized transport system fused permease subunit